MTGDPMERAVAPNLLDAVVDPELVFSLVLANLMSPRLWKLAAGLGDWPAPAESLPSEIADIQKLIDHHYEHVTPARIFETNGALDLEFEAGRLGVRTVEYAWEKILSAMEGRVKRGSYDAEKAGLDFLRQHQLPAYVYATIDEAYACRRLMHGRKHKPLGLTCCVDEAALFAALTFARRIASAESLTFLASPAHHTAFLRTSGDAWWFYGKHDLFSAAEWKKMVSESFEGKGQSAFDFRLPNLDRVMSAAGSIFFGKGETSMSDSDLAEQVGRVDAFFGIRLAQLDRALHRGLRPVGNARLDEVFTQIDGAIEGADVHRRLRGLAFDGQPAALRALYAFRTLDVPDPNVYLRAARTAVLRTRFILQADSFEAAVGQVAAVKGCESIFEDNERIAMPDETVRFGTGSDRDKALLLHVMLERHHEETDSARGPVETLITNADSYVVNPPLCFSIRRMTPVASTEGRPLYRFGSVTHTQ
jgi:hypothetical protein